MAKRNKERRLPDDFERLNLSYKLRALLCDDEGEIIIDISGERKELLKKIIKKLDDLELSNFTIKSDLEELLNRVKDLTIN